MSVTADLSSRPVIACIGGRDVRDTFSAFLAAALGLALVAVLVSKNATVASKLTDWFKTLSDWIAAAMGPAK